MAFSKKITITIYAIGEEIEIFDTNLFIDKHEIGSDYIKLKMSGLYLSHIIMDKSINVNNDQFEKKYYTLFNKKTFIKIVLLSNNLVYTNKKNKIKISKMY